MIALFDPHMLRSLTVPRINNILKTWTSFYLSKISKKPIVWGRPYILTVEPTSTCNLRCPQCATGSGELKRSQGKLPFTIFRQVIDELSDVLCHVVLYNQGEPFLHEDLFNFILYMKRKRIYIITSTNGHFLTEPDIAEKIVASGLDAIIISLDAADDRTYSEYRKNGNFKKVVAGIEKLVHIRNSCHPKIYIQFLVMKHNEHQIDRMKALAGALKVDRFLLKTVQVNSAGDALKFAPANDRFNRYHLKGNALRLKNESAAACSRLWTSTTLLSDGTIVPCCFDKFGKYPMGAVSVQSHMKAIWQSEAYEKFRRINLRCRESLDICGNCTQGQKVYL